MNRSYAITLRTRVGVNDKMIEIFDEWMEKQTYGVWTMEKEGADRHIHAQIWLKLGRTKGNVEKSMKRILKKCYTSDQYEEKPAVKVKPAYNDDFVETYMKKDGIEHLTGTVPNEENPGDVLGDYDASDYYPTEEEQLAFIAGSQTNHNWTLWTHLEEIWHDRIILTGTALELDVAFWLSEQMFDKRVIKVEPDARKRQQMLRTFVAFLTKARDADLFLPKNWKG
jgi:hypothetical protein